MVTCSSRSKTWAYIQARQGVPRFILNTEIANFRPKDKEYSDARTCVDNCMRHTHADTVPTIRRGGTIFLFVSVMVFGDTWYLMNKDRLSRFSCL